MKEKDIEKKEMSITTLKELKKYADGIPVQLPPFASNCPFVALLRRPSVVRLAREGAIPNPLLPAAMELFTGDKPEKKKEDKLKEMAESRDVMTVIARAAMVSPTYDELTEIGLELTESQLIAIYNFTQTGIQDMLSFRTDKKD